MPKTFFVTGIDTEVGKTCATAAILHAARTQGLRTLALKPVAAGCDETADGLVNEDALMLQQHMTQHLPYDQVNPIALKQAIAPHIAAKDEGRTLTVARLAGLCRGALMQSADLALIEGAGGWMVPLNDRETLAHLAVTLQTPVILVVALRLGCLNHALLTARAIQNDGLRLAGWVANRTSSQPMQAESENIATLRQWLGAPCLGVLPYADPLSIEHLAAFIDLQPLLAGAG